MLLFSLVLLSGCGQNSTSKIINNLEKKVKNADNYKVEGELELLNNDEVYVYDISVCYKKDNLYRVSLTNKANNHTQVILKNNDGVYVLTPALNKSFKFQSDWPYNNSQIYLLKSLVNDIKNTKDLKMDKVKDGYIIFTDVDYPNNKKLVKQSIKLNKKLNLKEVKVYDDNNVVIMKMTFKNIDLSPVFKKNYFDLDVVMNTYADLDSNLKDVTSLDTSIYPLVIPSGTRLINEEKIKKDKGERILMTFDGDKPFLLVEETALVEPEFTIVPTYGEPFQLMDSLGVMTDNSLTWVSNGIEYFLVSDVLNKDEMIEVAQSINILPTMK